MDNIPKGGRGHRAPYETTHRRIPTDIKPEIEILIDRYRTAILNGEEYTPMISEDYRTCPLLPPYEEMIGICKKIIRQKQSLRKGLAKLVSILYKVDCNPKDL